MHYKNGREAKAGDVIVSLSNKQMGVLHSVIASTDTCNGRLASTSPNDPYINIKDCLHVDDIAAADIPDTCKG
jgi:hypothetical protein